MAYWMWCVCAVVFFLVDLATFFLPLGALGVVVVVLTRPRWFRALVDDLYAAP